MAVRIKLELRFKNRKVVVSALANAGYEADEPEVLVPKNFAKKIGATGGRKEWYHTAGGVAQLKVAGKATVRVLTEDKVSPSITAKLVISQYEDEVIINDKLVEDTGLNLLKVKKGIWRFLDDPITKERPSVPKESW